MESVISFDKVVASSRKRTVLDLEIMEDLRAKSVFFAFFFLKKSCIICSMDEDVPQWSDGLFFRFFISKCI